MFRQQGPGQVPSPDELDRLMRVTRPRLWLALVTIVGLVAAGIFWTIFTRIPSTAATTGSPVASGSRTHPARPKNPPA